VRNYPNVIEAAVVVFFERDGVVHHTRMPIERREKSPLVQLLDRWLFD
jgi:hypothetical protein